LERFKQISFKMMRMGMSMARKFFSPDNADSAPPGPEP